MKFENQIIEWHLNKQGFEMKMKEKYDLMKLLIEEVNEYKESINTEKEEIECPKEKKKMEYVQKIMSSKNY
jgi:hypothetical protein